MKFRDVIGQQRAVRVLQNAVVTGRVAGAYLFCGPEGAGKRRLARIFAMALNCSRPDPAGEPCGECRDCRKVARDDTGIHPDVAFIRIPDDEQALKIDQMRTELVDRLGFAPLEGRTRVFIVESAHRLTEEAQNALLKSLEETPPRSTIVLLTESVPLILPTVQSRCQRVDLLRPSDGLITDLLVREYGIDRERAAAVARTVNGNLRLAKASAADGAWERRDEWLAVTAAAAAGRLDRSTAVDFGRSLARADFEPFLAAFCSAVRDMLVLATGAGAESCLNPGRQAELAEAAGLCPTGRLDDLLAAGIGLLRATRVNLMPSPAVEALLLTGSDVAS